MRDSLSIVAMAINLLYNRRFKCETKTVMPVLIISEKATTEQMQEMLLSLESYIKLAVDIELGILSGGGKLHADCESELLENGSKQENVWGADWLPFAEDVTFESLINVRPRQNNFSMIITDPELRSKIETVARKLLEGVEYERS